MKFLHHNFLLYHATNMLITLQHPICHFIELQSLHTPVVSRATQMEMKLNSLNLELKEFKKIEELRISSSHDSEVIKYHKNVGVQFNYTVPVSG